MHDIQTICERVNLVPRALIEFGPMDREHMRLGYFIERNYPVTLVEANPRLFYCLSEGSEDGNFEKTWPNIPPPPYKNPGLASYPNVTLIHAAIAPRHGKVKVYERNASSFMQGILSPAKVNDGYEEQGIDAYEVDSITITDIDDGTIDVLLADIEGSEWFCLNGLVSRPRIIVLELFGWKYVNPHIEDILGWMNANGYKAFSRDETDVLFIKETDYF